MGALLSAGTAYAATNWTVGVNSGSSGQSQSGSVSNLTFSASSSPLAAKLLYPGGTGDVTVKITNPNPFPVTITSVSLPASTTYASGYTNGALTAPQPGCSATSSDVIWNYSTPARGSIHVLTTPVVIGASGQTDNPLTVVFTNDATMGEAAPAACEHTYFSMPSLIGIDAVVGGATLTASPVTDGWTK